ncbi:MAG: formylglycine-generating enzyme family protein [Candidatus Sericytochromatia bacterium]
MILVKGDNFIPPFTIEKKFKAVFINSFLIDKYPVTKKEYLDFIKNNPNWSKTNIPSIFADNNYLLDWTNHLGLENYKYNEPVTYVSWFAAKSYCESKQKKLPTNLEWEFAAYEENTENLDWYWKPQEKDLALVGKKKANSKGIFDFHNLIWEWTYDFNNAVINEDSREISGDIQKVEAFCGSTGNFKDLKNYPSFARYSFRSTLKADTTLKSLGFRCAKNL